MINEPNSALPQEDYPVDLNTLLTLTAKKGASDLHLTAGTPPIARIYGKLTPFDYPVLRPRDVENLVLPILEPQQRRVCG